MKGDRAPRSARPRGLTLLELLVAAALGAAVAAGAWTMFLSGSRQSVKLEARLGRVQTVLILLEELSNDLASTVAIPPPPPDAPACSGDLHLYRFGSYDLAGAEAAKDREQAAALRAEEVTYHFDAAAGRLLRNGRELPVEKLSGVTFRPPSSSSSGLGVDLSFASSESSTGTTYALLLPFDRAAAAEAFSSWQENYYDMKMGVERYK